MARDVAAFDAPDAQQKIITLPFGELPGELYMGLATNDTFTTASQVMTTSVNQRPLPMTG